MKLPWFLSTFVQVALFSVLIGALPTHPLLATCTGDDPCHACTNCKYCKHCAKEGGKCGVCK